MINRLPEKGELSPDTVSGTRFAMTFSELSVDHRAVRRPNGQIEYDPALDTIFHFEDDVEIKHFFEGYDNIETNDPALEKGVQLLLRTMKGSSSDRTCVEAVFSKQPFSVNGKSRIDSVEFLLVNGPQFFFEGKGLSAKVGDFRVIYRQFPEIEKWQKNPKAFARDYIATGWIEVMREDNELFRIKEAYGAASKFVEALEFIRGGRCGLGHGVGFLDGNQIGTNLIGFSKSDDFRLDGPVWWGLECVQDVDDFLAAFLNTDRSSDESRMLNSAISYYRISNTIRRNSGEMALVASQTALETLVGYILENRGGWSGSILGKRVSFHEKCRAAYAFCGINCDPIKYSEEIKKFGKNHKSADAFELLTIVRNQAVHPEKSTYGGLVLYESWQLSQWICEVMIFYLIGYRGKMYDRRKRTGYRGPAEIVPLVF